MSIIRMTRNKKWQKSTRFVEYVCEDFGSVRTNIHFRRGIGFDGPIGGVCACVTCVFAHKFALNNWNVYLFICQIHSQNDQSNRETSTILISKSISSRAYITTDLNSFFLL